MINIVKSTCSISIGKTHDVFISHIQRRQRVKVQESATAFLQRGRIASNAERGNTLSNSVFPPVCLSVRPSVTRWYQYIMSKFGGGAIAITVDTAFNSVTNARRNWN